MFLKLALGSHMEGGQTLFWVVVVIVMLTWVISAFDCERYFEAEAESKQLQLGYTGNIRDAHCTKDSDKERILEDVGDQEQKINVTVQVLMSAGMSTPDLRMAHELGVDINGTSHYRYGVLFLSLGVRLSFTIHAFVTQQCCSLDEFAFFICILWVVTYFFLPVDGRCFALALTEKLMVLNIAIETPLLFLGQFHSGWRPCLHFFWCLALLLSMAQIRRVCRIPFCGVWLVQALMAGSCRSCLRRPTRTLSESSSSDSTLSSASDGWSDAEPNEKRRETETTICDLIPDFGVEAGDELELNYRRNLPPVD